MSRKLITKNCVTGTSYNYSFQYEFLALRRRLYDAYKVHSNAHDRRNHNMKNFYCKIFINSLITMEQLSNQISELLNFKLVRNSIESDFFSIDFFKNKEFDEEKAKEFPDGFLYFPYFLDVDIVDESREAEYKEIIKKIMFYLWSEECQLVVSSDFEDELPHKGGYKSLINYN